MSKRVSKREAREQEALAVLQSEAVVAGGVAGEAQAAHSEAQANSESEGDDQLAPAPVGGFAALSLTEEEDEDEEEEDNEEKSEEPTSAPAPSSKSKKKRNKKNKKRAHAQNTHATPSFEPSADPPAAPASSDDDDEFADAVEHTTSIDDQKGTVQPSSSSSAAAAASVSKSKKKNKKKSKGKGQGKDQSQDKLSKKRAEDMTMEELDALLAADKASAPPPAPQDLEAEEGKESLWKYFVRADVTPEEIAAIETYQPLQAHLACQARNFDPQVELTRSFGAAAVRAYQAQDDQQGPSGRAGVSPAQAALEKRYFQGILNQNKRYKSILVQPQLGWPPFQGRSAGLSMTEFETSLGKRYSWLWSHAYKSIELEFIAAMHSVDPSGLYELVGKYPWHVHGQMQLSEIGKMQGDLGLRTTSLEKALYAMERSTTPSFHSALTTSNGKDMPRVTYRSPESRAFFLAAHKYVNCLTYKGTWRTALEWSKLILALDNDDPHCMVLWIDFLAIKTDQVQWFLELTELYEKIVDMGWNPGWHYSKALAYKVTNPQDRSGVANTLLDQAIKEHPLVASLILQQKAVDAPSRAVSQEHSSLTPVKDPIDLADEDGGLIEQLLAQLYAHRMLPLWKNSDHATWLAERLDLAYADDTMDTTSFHPYALHSQPEVEAQRTLWAALTHLTVSDLPEDMPRLFKSLIPRHLQPQQNILGELDPYPPPGTEMSERFFLR